MMQIIRAPPANGVILAHLIHATPSSNDPCRVPVVVNKSPVHVDREAALDSRSSCFHVSEPAYGADAVPGSSCQVKSMSKAL